MCQYCNLYATEKAFILKPKTMIFKIGTNKCEQLKNQSMCIKREHWPGSGILVVDQCTLGYKETATSSDVNNTQVLAGGEERGTALRTATQEH